MNLFQIWFEIWSFMKGGIYILEKLPSYMKRPISHSHSSEKCAPLNGPYLIFVARKQSVKTKTNVRGRGSQRRPSLQLVRPNQGRLWRDIYWKRQKSGDTYCWIPFWICLKMSPAKRYFRSTILGLPGSPWRTEICVRRWLFIHHVWKRIRVHNLISQTAVLQSWSHLQALFSVNKPSCL